MQYDDCDDEKGKGNNDNDNADDSDDDNDVTMTMITRGAEEENKDAVTVATKSLKRKGNYGYQNIVFL